MIDNERNQQRGSFNPRSREGSDSRGLKRRVYGSCSIHFREPQLLMVELLVEKSSFGSKGVCRRHCEAPGKSMCA